MSRGLKVAVCAGEDVGGTCVNRGCVPSKALLAASGRVREMSDEKHLADLGVTRSHSRPSVSNDNPYSEAWFKTLKYAPVFPDRFGSLADARAFMAGFVETYNHGHRHTGIGLHTPADALVMRKDPLAYARRLDWYRTHPGAFA